MNCSRQDHEIKLPIAFYEKVLAPDTKARFRFHYVSTSIILGFGLSFIHWSCCRPYGISIFSDWTWINGVILFATSAALIKGTKDLREFVTQMHDLLLQKNGEVRKKYSDHYNNIVSTRRMLVYASVFGAANLLMGVTFGYWYSDLVPLVSIGFTHFVLGFFCGMGVNGIFGIKNMMKDLSCDAHLRLNFFAPDRCGGTLIIGRILLYLALYAIATGTIIAGYIYISPWQNRNSSAFVDYLIMFWMIWPFFISFSILVSPVIGLHKRLRAFKLSQGVIIQSRLNEIAERILKHRMESDNTSAKLGCLKENFDEVQRIESYLSKLQTWPYNLKYRLVYVFSSAIPVILSLISEKNLQVLKEIYKVFQNI